MSAIVTIVTKRLKTKNDEEDSWLGEWQRFNNNTRVDSVVPQSGTFVNYLFKPNYEYYKIEVVVSFCLNGHTLDFYSQCKR